MSNFKITKSVTISDFRYAFSLKYTHIYFRVAKNKYSGKKLLSSFESFQENSEISFDGSQTVEQFERHSKSLTGVDIDIYIEVCKNTKSRYILCSKEYSAVTLESLEKIALEMNAVSQVSYMKSLIATKNITTEGIKSSDKTQTIDSVINDVDKEKLITDEEYRITAIKNAKHIIDNFWGEINFINADDISLTEKIEKITKEVHKFRAVIISSDENSIFNYLDADYNLALDYIEEEYRISNVIDKRIISEIFEPLLESANCFNELSALKWLVFPGESDGFNSMPELTNEVYYKMVYVIDDSISTEELVFELRNEEFYILSDACPEVSSSIEEHLLSRDPYDVLCSLQDYYGCLSEEGMKIIIAKFEEEATDDQKEELADFVEELKANLE